MAMDPSPLDPGQSPGVLVDAAVSGSTSTESRSGVVFVSIDGGTFTMGSPADEEGRFDDEGPQHEVAISAFEMGETEVTNGQYARFAKATFLSRPRGWTSDGPDDEPKTGLSWGEAQAFARWIGARLPTEAEWEYAARAGSTESRYGPLDMIAWYADDSTARKHPVRQKAPNAWGLYDTLGNVWEWCSDLYAGYSASSANDPSGPAVGRNRVLRGASYLDGASSIRTTNRGSDEPDFRTGSYGFRVARGPTGTAK